MRSRSTSRFRPGLIAGAALTAVAGIACSRPTAPAMVSRSDSVQVASASSRSIARRSSPVPPKIRSASAASRPSAAARTSQRVTDQDDETDADAGAEPDQVLASLDVAPAEQRRRLLPGRGAADGDDQQQQRAADHRAAEQCEQGPVVHRGLTSCPALRARAAGSRSCSSSSMQAIGACAAAPAVRARCEHLAGQHPAVPAGHLADALDVPAQAAAVLVVVAACGRTRRSRARRRSASGWPRSAAAPVAWIA